MNVIFRASQDLMARVREDLGRPHAYAAERVGFITVRAAAASEHLVLLAQDYYPVADDDYLHDDSVGAMVGQEGLRKALEIALLNPVGVFHVHQHCFGGRLWFSRTDLREQHRYVPDFFKVQATMPHGAVVLGPRLAAGRVWLSANTITRIAEFNEVGANLISWRSRSDGSTNADLTHE